MLLGVMQWYLTPMEVLPIHSAVQFISNGSRALLSVRDTHWRKVWQFLGGAVMGTTCGSFCVGYVTPERVPLFAGLMILTTSLLPRSSGGLRLPGRYVLCGIIQGTVGMLTGAAGPLATATLQRDGLNREQIVVTTAMMMTFLNSLKIIAFLELGSSLGHYRLLLALMLVSSLFGTWVGTALRGRIPEASFQRALKVILVGLGLQLTLL